ncbi:MAG: MFS transporter [Candidatus Altiarchaeota archaeon]
MVNARTSKADTPQEVKVFGAASFLNDFGSDMVYPIWPLFVVSLGVDMRVLGIIDGLGDALVYISPGVSGYLSDKWRKRKVFIWLGYLMGAFSRVGYALSRTWHPLPFFKILDRAGKMRGAPRDAIIADASTVENRGRNFGYLRTFDNMGAVCGIITTLVLVNYVSFSIIFLVAAIPSFIAVALIYKKITDRPTANIHKGVSIKNLSRNFKVFLTASMFFALASFSYSFFIVYANKIGFAKTTVPVLYLLFTVFAALSSLPFGKLADKLGRKTLMQAAFLLFTLTCAGFAITQSRIIVVALFILYGLHRGALDTVQKAYAAELAPEAFRASSLGFFQMVVGLLALPASFIAGFLWDMVGPQTMFSFSAVMAFTGAAIISCCKRGRQ